MAEEEDSCAPASCASKPSAKANAETQRGQTAAEAKPVLTRRRREAQRDAERKNSLRPSAPLCVLALKSVALNLMASSVAGSRAGPSRRALQIGRAHV